MKGQSEEQKGLSMTAVADPEEEPVAKKSKLPLIIGLVLAIAGGGGGFMAVQMGLIGGGGDDAHAGDEAHEPEPTALPPLAFVPLEPLLVSLPRNGERSYLRFKAQLEVRPEYVDEVTTIKPRIADVLNGYLRAVEFSELEDPNALVRLRGQMLRRLQVVAGEGRIRDLLIEEFVID